MDKGTAPSCPSGCLPESKLCTGSPRLPTHSVQGRGWTTKFGHDKIISKIFVLPTHWPKFFFLLLLWVEATFIFHSFLSCFSVHTVLYKFPSFTFQHAERHLWKAELGVVAVKYICEVPVYFLAKLVRNVVWTFKSPKGDINNGQFKSAAIN